MIFSISTLLISPPRPLFFSFSLPTSGSIDLLALELGQSSSYLIPALVSVDDGLDGGTDLVLAGPDLGRAVSVSEREGVVLDGLEIDGDAERCAEFVVSGVSFADAGGRVVGLV